MTAIAGACGSDDANRSDDASGEPPAATEAQARQSYPIVAATAQRALIVASQTAAGALVAQAMSTNYDATMTCDSGSATITGGSTQDASTITTNLSLLFEACSFDRAALDGDYVMSFTSQVTQQANPIVSTFTYHLTSTGLTMKLFKADGSLDTDFRCDGIDSTATFTQTYDSQTSATVLTVTGSGSWCGYAFQNDWAGDSTYATSG